MKDFHSPQQNRLLNTLSKPELERLMPNLEWVVMPAGQMLYEPGSKQTYVYFPTTALVSILYVLEDGATTEVALVGNEGLLGIATFMGGDSTPRSAVVQNAGYGYRLKASVLKDEFNSNGSLFQLLLRYTQALITQMVQTAVCNRHHFVEQQLCRFLLLSIDRLPDNRLHMTQEQIASMLGVRREGVTEAAGKLQKSGFIEYYRGQITVLDRTGLENKVCECYQVVKTEFDRLVPSPKCQNHTYIASLTQRSHVSA